MPQEERQLVPVLVHVGNRLAQATVGLDLSVLDLSGQPSFQFLHLGLALSLVEHQMFFRGHLLVPGHGIVPIDIFEDL